ncbi:MAG TPA: DnaJ C-terminal domain-containing protein [Myxococcota bacterium]|nr:DnaJ C-terminal domain-containing protein [Myxococcota bacterium]
MAKAKTRDPYAILGVARDADDATIRKVYRKLARELHPDVNPNNPAAEDRFKSVSEAYSVLSDPEKRKAYDEFGEIALQPGFDAAEARRAREAFGGGFGGFGGFEGGGAEFGEGGFEDLLSNLFGRAGSGRTPRRRRGADLEASLELDFLDAARGCEKRLEVARPTRDGGVRSDSVTVRIPPGVADGGQIRLRGKGGEGAQGGAAGDLIATIRVRPHPLFRREGRDILLEVPLTIAEATLGTKVDVPSLDGRVTVTVPPGTDSGARLRLRGKGVPNPGGGRAGDFFVLVKICVPRKLGDAARRQLAEIAADNPPDLRRSLKDGA